MAERESERGGMKFGTDNKSVIAEEEGRRSHVVHCHINYH